MARERKGVKGREVQEYEDEETLATVTVIEDCEPEAFRHVHSAATKTWSTSSDFVEGVKSSQIQSGVDQLREKKRGEMKAKEKSRPKKTAYETKAVRKAARLKQQARKLEKAELAGGKVRRRASGKVGKRGKR